MKQMSFIQLRVSVTVKQKESLSQMASAEMTSMSHIVRLILQQWLEDQRLGKKGGSSGYRADSQSDDRGASS